MGLNGGAGIPVITATASGNPLSFVTDMVRPLKSLVIPFTPIQAAGTPSPDNPLPISGWTGCEIEHGEFVTDDVGVLYQGGLSTVDGSTQNSNYRVRSSAISVEAGKTYTIDSNINYVSTRYYSTNAITGYIGYESYQQTPATFTVPDGAITMRLVFANSINTTSTITPSQVTKHDVYKGNIVTLPVAFTDPTTGDPMTVYGGTLTLNEDGSADLVATWRKYLVKNMAVGAPGSGTEPWVHMFRVNVWENNTYVYLNGKFLSTCFIPYTNSYYNGVIRSTANQLYVYDNTITTESEFKNKYGEESIAFVTKPEFFTTYHFDNIGQLMLFAGENNIWTDTNGTNTATYLKHQS